jgi:hypothetical protein
MAMPDISFSVKDIADVVSSVAKAFDDPYSTLRRIAIDGWSGVGTLVSDIKNHRDEENIRQYVIILRNLQVTKISAAARIVFDIYTEPTPRWDYIERILADILSETQRAIQYLERSTNIVLPTVLKDKFPALVKGLHAHDKIVGHLIDKKFQISEESVIFDNLVDLLDQEAVMIGKCADLLTDFIELRRSGRLSRNILEASATDRKPL